MYPALSGKAAAFPLAGIGFAGASHLMTAAVNTASCLDGLQNVSENILRMPSREVQFGCNTWLELVTLHVDIGLSSIANSRPRPARLDLPETRRE
jgi:hypothetical protein